MKKFKEIFQNRNYLRLFLANFTSQLGSTIGLTAFMFYLLDRFSDQPAYASITELMYSLPTLAVFFIVGVLADRMDRQKIAYYCDWISAILSLTLMVAIYVGWMPLIFAVLFLRSAVQKFFFPAEHGMVQGILKKDDYTTAAGLNQLVMSLFMLFGNGFGIFAYWTVGIYGALVVDVLSFLISALLIRACKIDDMVRMPNGKHRIKDLSRKMMLDDFKSGFFYILKNKLLRTLLIGFFVFGVVNGGFSVMPVFMLKYKLAPEMYEQFSIVIGVVFGTGILIGSFIASLLSQKIKLYQLIIYGLIVTGGFVICSSVPNNLFWFMVIIFISSVSLPLINIGIGGWMPSIVDPKMMGRVQGMITPLMMLSQSLTLGFITVTFPKLLSIEALYWLVGSCLIIVGIFYLCTLPKYSSENEQSDVITEAKESGV
ncbi:MFS transporter [Robertmurraya sp. FSL W8-0741]|uniref:MFS transporter n=1 Tax=Robertmurraya TaxID=2837507 RepID=UPI0010F83AAF|nr:MFS transporter [Robertmurraya siralis]